jgi:hypothetical protein
VAAFHFISGLPRSGSTLLAALLRQNPRFHAGMTSPVGTLFTGMLNQFSAGSEFGPVIDQPLRRRLLRGLFDAYYADRVRPVIKLLDRRTVLPPDLYEKYSALSFWRDGTGSAANVIRAKSD